MRRGERIGYKEDRVASEMGETFCDPREISMHAFPRSFYFPFPFFFSLIIIYGRNDVQ